MEKTKVDVIIPVFNTGKALDKCLSSVCNQSFRDWKCTIVNDCSTNRKTLSIIEKWCLFDSRFVRIDKQQNEGVDAARFTGIDSTDADYVTFVDSDDWLEKDALMLLVNVMQENRADVVVARNNKYYGFLGKKKKNISKLPFESRLIEHDELMQNYFVSFFGCNILPVTVWAVLYSRKLFVQSGVRPTGLKFGEDLMFNLSIFPYIQRFYAIEDYIYNYNVGIPGAYSGKYMQSWLDNAIKLFEYKWQILEQYNDPELARFQAIEMKNYIGSYLRFSILYDPKHKDENISVVKSAIDHPIFKKMKYLQSTKHISEPLTKCVIDGDAEGAYAIMDMKIHNSSIKDRMIVTFLQLTYRLRQILS